MDPTATLRMIVDSLDSLDIDNAEYLARELRQWLAKGGFPPVAIPVEPHVADWLAEHDLGEHVIA